MVAEGDIVLGGVGALLTLVGQGTLRQGFQQGNKKIWRILSNQNVQLNMMGRAYNKSLNTYVFLKKLP